MEANDIFYPDIWDKILLTDTSVLNEIVGSEFEREVFEIMRPSHHL